MTNKNPDNPFNWKLRKGPSIFAQDPHFTRGAASSRASTKTVEEQRRKGNYATIRNLSNKAEERVSKIYKPKL